MVTREIPQRDKIEVYVNERGFVAISQGNAIGNDPAVIDLPHQDVPQLIKFLEEAMYEAQKAEEEFKPDKPKSPMDLPISKATPEVGGSIKPTLPSTSKGSLGS